MRSKTRMTTLTNFIQPSIGNPSHSNEKRKKQNKTKNKMNSNQKGKVKHSLFADDKILYLENFEDTTKKLPQFISEFVKVAGYKNNIKYFVFLCTHNELSERN